MLSIDNSIYFYDYLYSAYKLLINIDKYFLKKQKINNRRKKTRRICDNPAFKRDSFNLSERVVIAAAPTSIDDSIIIHKCLLP